MLSRSLNILAGAEYLCQIPETCLSFFYHALLRLDKSPPPPPPPFLSQRAASFCSVRCMHIALFSLPLCSQRFNYLKHLIKPSGSLFLPLSILLYCLHYNALNQPLVLSSHWFLTYPSLSHVFFTPAISGCFSCFPSSAPHPHTLHSSGKNIFSK